MRYLWVEDFNDNDDNDIETELKARLMNFFDLHDDKVIVKKTLSSAIAFLEDKDNLAQIDAVLIDIRFPKGDEDELYSRYFSDIVTQKFYDDNIEDASGILLYLLLVFRYHISQQKMAFVSANISSDNHKQEIIQNMIKIIAKSECRDLSEEDKESYISDEQQLCNNILNKSIKKKDWDTFINFDRQLEDVDVNKLINKLEEYYDEFKAEQFVNGSDKVKARVKYNTVKNQFDEIGFVMPSAFEKPKPGETMDKSYDFLLWEKKLYKNPYNAVRSNVQEMCIILIDYFKENKESRLFHDFLNLLTCNCEEKKYYDADFFTRYLKGVKGLFDIDCKDSMETFCDTALKQITALWEASALPKYNNADSCTSRRGGDRRGREFEHGDNSYYACHAVLKLTRNWVGHQGIKNVDIVDIGLIFLLNMRGIFDIDNLPEEYLHKYEKYEENILCMYKTAGEAEDEIAASLQYFYALNNATKEGDNSSRNIYEKISGIGHSQSKIRREVSMDEIYMLLYHILNCGCNGIYAEIEEGIKGRTWTGWKERYNGRFGKYIKCR